MGEEEEEEKEEEHTSRLKNKEREEVEEVREMKAKNLSLYRVCDDLEQPKPHLHPRYFHVKFRG